MESKAATTNLPAVNRFITTHDKNGKGVFTKGDLDSEEMPWEHVGGVKNFGLAYTTSTFPTVLQDDSDVKRYEQFLVNKPGMTISGGTVLRYVDYAPRAVSAHHRTISIDYGVVVEGSIELELDSGEVRLMKRGDVSICRAVIHGWRNPSPDQWCRVLFVLIDATPPGINGQLLVENYGKAMPGIKPSSTAQNTANRQPHKSMLLVTVNNAPERARRLVGRVIEEVADKWSIVHAANVEDPASARTVFASVRPDVVFTASMWTPEQSAKILAEAREVNPSVKTLALPQGLQVQQGPDAVVEWIKDHLGALFA